MKYIKTYEQIIRKMIDENKIYAVSFSWNFSNRDSYNTKDLIIGKLEPYMKDYVISGFDMHSENPGKKLRYVLSSLNNVREANQDEINFYNYWQSLTH